MGWALSKRADVEVSNRSYGLVRTCITLHRKRLCNSVHQPIRYVVVLHAQLVPMYGWIEVWCRGAREHLHSVRNGLFARDNRLTLEDYSSQ